MMNKNFSKIVTPCNITEDNSEYKNMKQLYILQVISIKITSKLTHLPT